MTDRIPLDDLTSDALDTLYEQLDAAEAGEAQRQLATAREALASATTRAARAEAAIARVRAVAGWAIQGWSDLSPEKVLLAVDGEQPASAPAAFRHVHVTITNPDEYTANRQALSLMDWVHAEFPGLIVTTDAREWTAPAATQATDGCTPACNDVPGIRGLLEHVGIDTTGRDITVAGRVVDAAPREHCGDLMPAWVAGPRTECVLPPSHAGSHADDRGARWWYDPHGTGHS